MTKRALPNVDELVRELEKAKLGRANSKRKPKANTKGKTPAHLLHQLASA